MSGGGLGELAARAASGDAEAHRRLVAAARAQARDILADGRFHEHARGGGPLHGLFARLGAWVDDLVAAMPGGTVPGWLLVGAVVAAVVATAASLALRRPARRGRAGGRAPSPTAAATLRPGDLERQAADAERAGDLAAAVRLRFRAGLLRLHDARAIELRPSATSGAIARDLRSPAFDALAGTHDAIAYGGHAAAPQDVRDARERWPQLLDEAGAR